MTGKGRELVNVFERRKIDIVCVQETKWTGKKARELGNGYKIDCTGEKNTRNGVVTILNKDLKTKVVGVERPNDRVIKMKLIINGEIFNIISVYAPPRNCNNQEKEAFYQAFEQIVEARKPDEVVGVGADMNGHVGKEARGFYGAHRDKGYGSRNEDGERVLKSCENLDLVLLNTYFTKKEHLITYSSDPYRSQIDFIMTQTKDFTRIQDCKVIPGEAVVTQHRLLCLKMKLSTNRDTQNLFGKDELKHGK